MKSERAIPVVVGEPVPNVLDLTAMEAARVRRRQARALRAPLYILVPLAGWLAWPAGVAPLPVVDEPGAHAEQLDSRLNPNTAQWWELTALPRIGKTLAQRIVTYRTTHRKMHTTENRNAPVFGSPADLQRVRGIGPKTVARLAAHLAFPANRVKFGSPQPAETPRPIPPDL